MLCSCLRTLTVSTASRVNDPLRSSLIKLILECTWHLLVNACLIHGMHALSHRNLLHKCMHVRCRGEEERLQAQTSRYHGVRQNKRSEKWESYIRVAGKHLHLGCHDSEVAAAQAFDQAVMLRHVYCRDGETSVPLVTNFPPEYYQVCLSASACCCLRQWRQ